MRRPGRRPRAEQTGRVGSRLRGFGRRLRRLGERFFRFLGEKAYQVLRFPPTTVYNLTLKGVRCSFVFVLFG